MYNLLTKSVLITILSLLTGTVVSAQSFRSSYVQQGEFGIGLGAAHYFGDLNTKARLNRPKGAATLFFRKNFNNYLSARLGVSYAQLGYSDIYNKHNEYMQRRNLSFNSNVWELALQGDFNFFYFMPGEREHSFTPYVTLGVGAFSYDPYAYYSGEKYFLRTLGTEGQGTDLYPDRKQYGTVAMSIPVGIGFKYALNERINLGFEVVHRFTNTDYLDDVSKTYVNPSVFQPVGAEVPNPGYYFHDRSGELGAPIGVPGRQRGNSRNKDQFVTGMFYLTYNLQSYRCPTVR